MSISHRLSARRFIRRDALRLSHPATDSFARTDHVNTTAGGDCRGRRQLTAAPRPHSRHQAVGKLRPLLVASMDLPRTGNGRPGSERAESDVRSGAMERSGSGHWQLAAIDLRATCSELGAALLDFPSSRAAVRFLPSARFLGDDNSHCEKSYAAFCPRSVFRPNDGHC